MKDRFLITGATGYIGSMLTRYIIKKKTGAQVIALARDSEKASSMLPDGVQICCVDLTDQEAMNQVIASGKLQCDYLIHCASVTKSSEMIAKPVEVTQSIVNATQNVLELARACEVRSMVMLSSMEIYGNITCQDGQRVSEEEMGYVDLLNARSCYPLGKRMAENICYSYYKEYGVPVKIARLAQTFGKGILPTDNRVFVQFAKAAKEGRDIVLHTTGSSMGNYCSIADTLKGIMTILEMGANGEAYNVVNEANTMSIRQMAELVAEKFSDGKSKVVFDIPKENSYGYAATTGLRLSGEKLRSLGWQPTKGLAEMYRDVLDDLL